MLVPLAFVQQSLQGHQSYSQTILKEVDEDALFAFEERYQRHVTG